MALNARLILIKPYGFLLDEKSVRRAGLDYWKHVNLTEYENWSSFWEGEKLGEKAFYLFTKNSSQSYFSAKFPPDSYLIFGSETRGLPLELLDKHHEQTLSLPMLNPVIRSLNLANAATAVAYEAFRQNYHCSGEAE